MPVSRQGTYCLRPRVSKPQQPIGSSLVVIVMRRTRRSAALLAGGLFLAVFPPIGATGQTATCNGLTATQTGDYAFGSDAEDVFIGTPGPDRFYPEGGNDTICGLGGADEIDPGPGDDYVDGGPGADTVANRHAGGPTTVDLSVGMLEDPGGTDELVDIENATTSCSQEWQDVLIGSEEDNELSGGMGHDRLEGNGGDDTLIGIDQSYNRNDAVCWSDSPDQDTMLGGVGDDVLLGQSDDDQMDGGPGYDILDGDEGTDDCVAGERYANCEAIDPPPLPPECSDGFDDDDDGHVDYPDDLGCSSSSDPTEIRVDDPFCNDGFDNDFDGHIDFPGDFGCAALEEGQENGCHYFCFSPSVTFDHVASRGVFKGRVALRSQTCANHRRVVVKRRIEGGADVVARTFTRRGVDGYSDRWRIDGFPTVEGQYFAVLPKRIIQGKKGQWTCGRVHSETAMLRVEA